MTVRIERKGTSLAVTCPYNPGFGRKAKEIAGQWDSNGKTWNFDVRNEELVRNLLIDVYGTDDSATAELVSVKLVITLPDEEECQVGPTCGVLVIAGRVVAAASGRDSGARLGEGVVVVSGGFKSGGSMKNWATMAKPNTVVILHDVPRAVAEKAVSNWEEGSGIVPGQPRVDIEALKTERERLLARVAEIDVIVSAAA